MGYAVPLSGTTTLETVLPAYNSASVDSFPPKAMKYETDFAHNLPLPRKRQRDSTNPFFFCQPVQSQKTSDFSFLGEDISLQIQQQHLDVDLLVSQHMEKVRLEIEERRKRQARRIIEELEVGLMKRLRAKEEEIQRMGRLNWALEEKIKSLCIENQIWRDLAQTNEATANALRSNLEHVLAQVTDEGEPAAALIDDAQSCCGSNGACAGAGDGDEEDSGERNNCNNCVAGTKSTANTGKICKSNGRWCRNCWKEESCVLLLPCRHLCLCTVCGSFLHTCPVCKSVNNGSVHVIMS